MKVSDEVMLHGSIDEVWQAINDPAVLVRTIPGCELLEVIGPDRYRIVVSAGVAAIRGVVAPRHSKSSTGSHARLLADR